MPRTAAIGKQDFGGVIEHNCFYVDKTEFIKEWWENGDDVTLITRPRRFGKTLTLSMSEYFFSVKYQDSRLFRGLDIWKEKKYRKLQGTYPVIFLSFANVKGSDYETIRKKICRIIADIYGEFSDFLDLTRFKERDREIFDKVSDAMDDTDAAFALNKLSELLKKYYGKKVIILLDEYDAPMQEAYVHGYWEDLSEFMRGFFNAAFKTNRCLERAVLTGITRISKESMFSDLNNLEVITAASKKYETVFGFTEEEVFQALDEYGLSDKKDEVKKWYDGFTFGRCRHIYNPWSIINFLDKKEFKNYWVNTSANTLVSSLIQKSDAEIKMAMEDLLRGGELQVEADGEIVFSQLYEDEEAVWSLLLASGYLNIERIQSNRAGTQEYVLTITNYEVHQMFRNMVRGWFARGKTKYNNFVEALITDNVDKMNININKIVMSTFSYFDTGYSQSESFYHAFVLGLTAELVEEYEITSNRESGLGRYDVLLVPKKKSDNGIIIEFKVYDPKKEESLEDTAAGALAQIEEKRYDTVLKERGIASGRIKKYGFAFRGKEVLIVSGSDHI